MESKQKEVTLEVPADFYQECRGLSMDIGNSVFKIVYRSKDDWKAFQEDDKKPDTGSLRCVLFTKFEIDKALDFLKDQCHITRDGTEVPLIYCTGMNCHVNMQKIQEALNIKLEVLAEFDMFCASLQHLCKEMPAGDILHPIDRQQLGLDKLGDQLIKIFNAFESMTDIDINMKKAENGTEKATEHATIDMSVPFAESVEMYPCIIAMIGSGFCLMKITEDGALTFLDATNRSGVSFLGLGALLTGAQTFEEIIELATKGDERNVHTWSTDFEGQREDKSDDIYGNVLDSFQEDIYDDVGFFYGKAVGKKLSDFRREDVARALINATASDMVEGLVSACKAHDVSRAFFCGSFINAEIIRDYMAKWMVKKNVTVFNGQKDAVKYHFMKHGPFLGALGALLHKAEEPPTPQNNTEKTDNYT